MNFIISKPCCFVNIVEDRFEGFRRVALQLFMYRVVFCATGWIAVQEKCSCTLK